MKLGGIALAWFAYFVLHSVLAATGVKAWIGRHWPRVMPAYRLAFNLLAVLTLLPVLWLVYGTAGEWLWRWQGAWAWLANGLALAAMLGFLATGRSYDMAEFLGLRQLHKPVSDDAETFSVSLIHRFVRHPWYCIGLVLIWSRDMNGPLLVSALMITAYLVIGSKLEEGKLIASIGEPYRRYMAQVPGLIPLPWKHLTAAQAAALTQHPAQD